LRRSTYHGERGNPNNPAIQILTSPQVCQAALNTRKVRIPVVPELIEHIPWISRSVWIGGYVGPGILKSDLKSNAGLDLINTINQVYDARDLGIGL
jgi:hypothetical protein